MKKKLLSILIAIFIILPCILLTGCIGGAANADGIDFRVENGYIQYTTNGTDWENIIKIDDIKGSDSFTCTITYDYGKASPFFETNKESDSTKSSEWLTNLPEIKETYKDAFLGWFIKDTNKKVEKYGFIGGDVTLEARFDVEAESCPSGLYQNGKYVLTWAEIVAKRPNSFLIENEINYGPESHSYDYWGFLDGELVVDNSITIIGSAGFSNADNLKFVKIPSNLEVIDDSAFWQCRNLENINIPYGVRRIGEEAFSLCYKLKEINLPNSVNYIGEGAFYSCESIENLIIPSSVIYMGNCLVSNCDNLSNLIVSQGNKVYDSRDNCNAIIETATNTLINGCLYTSIPNSVISIGDSAFYGWDKLISITIPESVVNIARDAFYDCDNLSNIVVEEGNVKYDSRDNCNAIIETNTNRLIIGCKNSIISETVKEIAQQAFWTCGYDVDLESIVLPESVTTVHVLAFCCDILELYINGAELANSLFADANGLCFIDDVKIVYIKTGFSVSNSTYLLENFTKQATSDKDGYDMYVKNS